MTYLRIIQKTSVNRSLYLAVPRSAYEEVFREDLVELFLEDGFVHLIVFDDDREVIFK